MIRPLTLPAPGVLAILREINAKGTGKTQFRRVLKVQPPLGFIVKCDDQSGIGTQFGDEEGDSNFTVPYAVGDLLWVRETWRVGAWKKWRQDMSGGRGDCPIYGNFTAAVALDYLADNFAQKEWLYPSKNHNQLVRLADQSILDAKKSGVFKDGDYACSWEPGDSPCRKRPSTQMPKWASRMTLRVTDVRVQWLQDISEADAINEGVEFGSDGYLDYSKPDGYANCYGWWLGSSRDSFGTLWNTTQGKPRKGRPDQSWDANLYVAAVTFEPVMRNVSEVTG